MFAGLAFAHLVVDRLKQQQTDDFVRFASGLHSLEAPAHKGKLMKPFELFNRSPLWQFDRKLSKPFLTLGQPGQNLGIGLTVVGTLPSRPCWTKAPAQPQPKWQSFRFAGSSPKTGRAGMGQATTRYQAPLKARARTRRSSALSLPLIRPVVKSPGCRRQPLSSLKSQRPSPCPQSCRAKPHPQPIGLPVKQTILR